MDAPGGTQRKQAMNSKLGTVFSTILIIAGVMLFSVNALAADSAVSESPETSQEQTRAQAESANRAAANDAVKRIRAANRLDLDIELIGRTEVRIAG
jgi:hypothetical protein